MRTTITLDDDVHAYASWCACLFGLAIKEVGVLITLDRGLKYMAGPEFSRNLVILE